MIPVLPTVDSSLALLADGYRYLSRTADRLGVDAFRTRIGLRPALCIRGADAARFFYEGGRFDRTASLPPTVKHLLQDNGSVQTLEDESHARRKSGFLELLGGSAEHRLAGIAKEEVGLALRRWKTMDRVVMHDELPQLFAAIALRWAGVPEWQAEADVHGPELWSMVVNAGSFGPSTWAALARRRRTESWARSLIAGVRDGSLTAVQGTPLHSVAQWRDDDGSALPLEIAAVELLNLLRPIVAVALFAEFALLALASSRDARSRFSRGDFDELDGFVHEVRRRTPFFPLIAGRARRDLEWQGETVKKGTWTLLDLYGTNHDPRLWPRPHAFDPSRYARGEGDAHFIVAQGSGDYLDDHRCPGEPATEALLREMVRVLSAARWWPVAGQSLEVTWGRMPARVRDGLVLTFR